MLKEVKMTFISFIMSFGVYLGVFVYCFVSGIVPILNTEVFLVAISVLIDKKLIFLLVLISVFAQMLAKTFVYLAARKVINISVKRDNQKFKKILKKMKKWEKREGIFIFLSALIGLPPFYLTTIACGTLKIGYLKFFIFGFCGALLRFSFFILLPQLIKNWIV